MRLYDVAFFRFVTCRLLQMDGANNVISGGEGNEIIEGASLSGVSSGTANVIVSGKGLSFAFLSMVVFLVWR